MDFGLESKKLCDEYFCLCTVGARVWAAHLAIVALIL